jgi:septum formation protein
MEPIILASSSPRRQEILKLLHIPCQVIMPNIDETITENIDIENIPELLARKKVLAVVHSLPSKQEIPWVLGADTVIVYNGKIYGKPENQEQASLFLHTFQGKTHTVITAVVLYNGRSHSTSSHISRTNVTFTPMTDDEIDWYVNTGEWHGAAGGYRIQSLASCFISKIEGSSSCVTGLPIFDLYAILKEQGYSILE